MGKKYLEMRSDGSINEVTGCLACCPRKFSLLARRRAAAAAARLARAGLTAPPANNVPAARKGKGEWGEVFFEISLTVAPIYPICMFDTALDSGSVSPSRYKPTFLKLFPEVREKF